MGLYALHLCGRPPPQLTTNETHDLWEPAASRQLQIVFNLVSKSCCHAFHIKTDENGSHLAQCATPCVTLQIVDTVGPKRLIC